MRLDDLCRIFDLQHFPERDAQVHPDRDAVLHARRCIGIAVANDEFLAECIDMEICRIKKRRFGRGLTPFFTTPDTGVQFAFGYWPPGGTPGPHEHTAWTITAVCRNELEVVTFDRDESYRRRELVPKNRFFAPEGGAGFIYEPCIHEPRNKSGDWSLSLHITSPRDGQNKSDYNEHLPALVANVRAPLDDAHPYKSVVEARRRLHLIHQLARIITRMNVPTAPQLLIQCLEVGSSVTRRAIERSSNGKKYNYGVNMGSRLLVRSHKDLQLCHHDNGNIVSLYAETANGLVEEFSISREASEAIASIANETSLDVQALPGGLTEDEKAAIGDALEEAGLFTRVDQ